MQFLWSKIMHPPVIMMEVKEVEIRKKFTSK